MASTGEGSVDSQLRGLKHEAPAALQLCLAVLWTFIGAHRNVLPTAEIDDRDAEVHDGGALMARAD